MSSRKSEFGRGYATCLRQFTFHRKRLDADLSEFMTEECAVELWANGASDHLYELVRPKRGYIEGEWLIAKHIQNRMLQIGHGFDPADRGTKAEAYWLLELGDTLLYRLTSRGYAVSTLEEALETDRQLGLRPDRGIWSCSEDKAPE